MQTPIENSAFRPTETSRLNLNELKAWLPKHIHDCLIFKRKFEDKMELLHNNYDDLILHYEKFISEVNQQIEIEQDKLKEVAFYGEDDMGLNSRFTSYIERQNKYLNELKSQLAKTKSLKPLFNLNPDQLLETAKKDKPSALLIIETPELMEKIPSSEIEHISHQDNDAVKSLAVIVAAREYTATTPHIYAALKEQVKTEKDQRFIDDQENENTRKLLLKMNKHLDEKIDRALKKNTHPWALGYFGSCHKLKKDSKDVSVPQAIYELKNHLDQLDTISPAQILSKIQTVLNTKVSETHDESMFQQFKRFISYLFGYSRSQETIDEYTHLQQIALGRMPV